jgi:plasmid stabilization system protein ParE
MKLKVSLSKTALVDLETIVEYYWQLNRKTATRYYKEILLSIKKLSSFPEIGRIVPEFEDNFMDKYRELIYGHYRIIYRIEPKRVFIIRIVDGHRLLTFDFIRDVL